MDRRHADAAQRRIHSSEEKQLKQLETSAPETAPNRPDQSAVKSAGSLTPVVQIIFLILAAVHFALAYIAYPAGNHDGAYLSRTAPNHESTREKSQTSRALEPSDKGQTSFELRGLGCLDVFAHYCDVLGTGVQIRQRWRTKPGVTGTRYRANSPDFATDPVQIETVFEREIKTLRTVVRQAQLLRRRG
jgi:hypothetical protein